jgi:hypothetical protein
MCGCGDVTPTVSSRPPNHELPVASGETARTGSFAVHEWGLVDVNASATDLAAVRAIPIVARPSPHRTAAPAKPVLYVHLADGVDTLDLDLEVQLTGGAMLEHWPLAERDGTHTVRWSGVTARRGSCRGSGYPGRGDAVCRVADGICEASELALYETSDGACLEHGGRRQNLLFYRGTASAAALPLTVTLGTNRELTVTRRDGAHAAGDIQLLRVLRSAADARVAAAVFSAGQTSVQMPTLALREACAPHAPAVHGRGHTCDEVRAMEVADASEDLDRAFSSIGLTDEERLAFERAWSAELVRPGITGVADALLYVLPENAADAMMPLVIEPAPTEVRRAHLVRVNLSR